MPYQTSTYYGDALYEIEATGDCCVGDYVRFDRALFAGSRTSPKFVGFERISGEIVKDSYGELKQQHTFTLLLEDGSKTLIKGRNLYANGVWRKVWIDETQRETVLTEKHNRGDQARKERDARRTI
jgi:hypothetical protein